MGITPGNSTHNDPGSGIACLDGTFWTVSEEGIDQFILTSGVITKIDSNIYPETFVVNLGYCNNLNGGAFSPTFYSTVDYDKIAYFDGSGVTQTINVSPDRIYNPGGYNNYLYYSLHTPANSYKASTIVRYDGTSLTPVYTFPEAVTMGVADLAADSLGNVWVFTGPKATMYQTDTLKVISPEGVLIHKYPFNYFTQNGYGTMFMSGKLYIGFGDSHPTHPNTLLPLTISSSTVTPGTPIPVPAPKHYNDMANCPAGGVMSVTDPFPINSISLSPNPFTDKLTVTGLPGEKMDLILYDIMGREVIHQSFTGSVTLNMEQLVAGLYPYRIIAQSGREQTGKVLKD